MSLQGQFDVLDMDSSSCSFLQTHDIIEDKRIKVPSAMSLDAMSFILKHTHKVSCLDQLVSCVEALPAVCVF